MLAIALQSKFFQIKTSKRHAFGHLPAKYLKQLLTRPTRPSVVGRGLECCGSQKTRIVNYVYHDEIQKKKESVIENKCLTHALNLGE